MAKTAEERETEIVGAIRTLKDDSEAATILIRERWRENYDMFIHGTVTLEKADWQTNFSVNKLNTSIRAAQGKLVNTLVNTPDWYEIAPKSKENTQAEQLAPAFKKALDYYIDASNFKRHAGTFFMCALISSGNMHLGWTQRLVQNPAYVLAETEAARRRQQLALASKVTNPQVEVPDALSGDGMEASLSAALADFQGMAQGAPPKPAPIPQYVQVGALDIRDINHEKSFWDPNVMYMEDSTWRAFEYEVNLSDIKALAKQGVFKRSAVKRIGSTQDFTPKNNISSLRYNNTIEGPMRKSKLVNLLVYYGPLIVKDEIIQDRYSCVIANNRTILREGSYPYWEPPGHSTPVITAAVRQIPYRAAGAGIGDNAVSLQKIYDSNWQLICDTFRYGISGINVVNYQNLVDKGQLDEGIYPGMTLHVRGKPEDSFKRIELTSNLENQSHPVQTMLEQAIDSLTGVNELMTGGSNPYSRTSVGETNARVEAGADNVNIIALDLEQNFLIPALQKMFARVLQFGLLEINSNPELQALFNAEELYELQQLNAQSKLQILNQWYAFKVTGFSTKADENEAAQRDNELLQIINSGGPLASLLNLPNFMKQYLKNRGYDNTDDLLINDSPLVATTNENQLLMSGHPVAPLQTDDHKFHIQQHAPLANSPYATPPLQQHLMIHEQMLQAQQAAQQQVQQGGGPPGAAPMAQPAPAAAPAMH